MVPCPSVASNSLFMRRFHAYAVASIASNMANTGVVKKLAIMVVRMKTAYIATMWIALFAKEGPIFCRAFGITRSTLPAKSIV